ncbi:Benzoate 4-monooxygenase cytochrome P450 [Colletotrichum higginsianum IMI 349063]|uniref:Benzoate 4-monooxygenase cytochrome P450 n=1 Tax=Colletotrichum higginsianum (strain IMI 349063) TaxID=759273 RepID=A0A1B7Y0D0_COLHI|nr:Benzoate 4-monooxygenase cytochrome P450 [Colletotrichum higginsianum IMI 349063]OBR05473.1 Benzoate 4-monooxygenase cytochrome P450 [Colletotrichum higginsianum IMI 349063]
MHHFSLPTTFWDIFTYVRPQLLYILLISYIAWAFLMARQSPFPGPFLAKVSEMWMARFDMKGKRTSTIQSLHAKYGPVVQIGPASLSFSSANSLRDIFNHSPKLSRPRGDAEFLEQFGHVNMASTRCGDVHFQRRKAVAGAYAAPVVASPACQAMMNELTDRFMENLQKGAQSDGWGDIWPQFRWLAADIMARLVYGDSSGLNLLGDEQGQREMMEDLLGSKLTEADVFTLGVLMSSWFPRVKRALERLAPGWFITTSTMHSWGRESTARAVKAIGKTDGVVLAAKTLADYLRLNGSSKAVPSIEYIQSDNLDNFQAGSLTTPDTLSWLVYELSLPQNHHRQVRLREELQLAGIRPNTRKELYDLNKLPYLDCLLRETLRRYPPIPGSLTRVVPAGGITVDGHFVPGNKMLVSAQPASVNMDNSVYDDPNDWNPERWDIPRNSPEHRKMQRSFWPFGSGPRMCVGMNVAWAELRIVTARIFSTYETKLAQDYFVRDEEGNEVLKKLNEDSENDLFPAGWFEPIHLKEIVT